MATGRHPGYRWLAVAAWVGVIYATIPFARWVRNHVVEHFGRGLFTWVVLAVIVAVMGVVLFRGYRKPGRLTRYGVMWLVGIGVVYVGWTFHLGKKAPEEAIHFVQYGVLGILLFRAYRPSVGDWTIYLAAGLAGAVIGSFDEFIQWVTPQRKFDLRDIGLNAGSCGLALLAIAQGTRPSLAPATADRRSWVRVCLLGAALWAVFVVSLLNTPRVQHAAEVRFPVLEKAFKHTHAMTEYGHRIEMPGIAIFKSRFSATGLRAEDAARAVEAAATLDAYHEAMHRGDRPEVYRQFLITHSEWADPFLHEAAVHLYRRDHYRHLAHRLRRKDPVEARLRATVAYREHHILQAYFGETLKRSIFDLRQDTVAWLYRMQDARVHYRSPVSRKLLTRWSPGEVKAGLGVVLLVWAGGCGYLFWRAPGRDPGCE